MRGIATAGSDALYGYVGRRLWAFTDRLDLPNSISTPSLPADRFTCTSSTWHPPSLDHGIQISTASQSSPAASLVPCHRQSLPPARAGRSVHTTSCSTLGALLVSPPGYARLLHEARLALWLHMNRSLGVHPVSAGKVPYQNQTTGTAGHAPYRTRLLHTQLCGTCQPGPLQMVQYKQFRLTQLRAPCSTCSFSRPNTMFQLQP